MPNFRIAIESESHLTWIPRALMQNLENSGGQSPATIDNQITMTNLPARQASNPKRCFDCQLSEGPKVNLSFSSRIS